MSLDMRLDPGTKGSLKRTVTGLGLPVALLAIAIATVTDGLRIVTSAPAANQDHQAGWFILALGLCFAFFVIISSSSPLRRIRKTAKAAPAPDDQAKGSVPGSCTGAEARSEGYLKRALTAVGLTVAWAIALPWAGFAVTNGLFLAAFMILVGRRRVVSSLLLALAISTATTVAFSAVGVFLPRGIFGI